MYQGINKAIDQVISKHKKTIERDTHYYIQGLEVAKLLVDQTQEIDVEEVPYETFENIVQILSNYLEKEDMEKIIAEVFISKEDEDGQENRCNG
ncbi:hypothetical protein LCM23_13195 [Cytobacillus kochii]|uniref:hypothetical protein n=1 Tax=Cytobacillus kochii TaxID=859143 RepID=UPI001CD388B5|nr:hypothetical protein [Cytobacillus kochii]MCA1027051.1 hypothetical protein [Cytobacillus kochii]